MCRQSIGHEPRLILSLWAFWQNNQKLRFRKLRNVGYELPRGEFRRLVSEGMKAQRAEEREHVRAERERRRYEGAEERQLYAARRAEYQSVIKRIRALGGIRPYRAPSTGKQKSPELEEWRDLPRAVKTRNMQCGRAADDIAQTIREEFPWLNIERDSDLAAYLKNEQYRRRADLHLGHNRAA